MTKSISSHLLSSSDLGDVAKSALNACDQGIAVIDNNGVIKLSNRAFRDLFSLSSDIGALADGVGLSVSFANRVDQKQIRTLDGRLVDVRFKPQGSDFVVIATDASIRLAEVDQTLPYAQCDHLTKLGTRATLALDADQVPPHVPYHLLAIDLDRFKLVNDTMGHPLGDKLLTAVADRLRTLVVRGCSAYRLGGDEFALLMVEHDGQTSERMAKRIVDLLGRAYIIDGHIINSGASVGVASGTGGTEPFEEIVRFADLALYAAKASGRNDYRMFVDEMDQQRQARHALELDLRRALALREFELVYQPQLNLAHQKITGFEALLRWRHPARGLVSPADFIPLAEELKLIIPIGEWVLNAACAQAMTWSAPLRVAVNVSAVQFEDPRFFNKVQKALSSTGLPAERLEVEITESVLLGDKSRALQVLHQIRDLGVKISMDDFGTGYSSLSYLRSFPFEKIKIDQSFVRGQPNDPTGLAIVRAIAALGASLGMTTTAEGVETSEQMQRIAEDGCTDVQGYLISRPLPESAIETFMTGYKDYNS